MNAPDEQSVMTLGGMAAGATNGYVYEHELCKQFD